MPKLRELIQTPPEPEGGAEEQLEALRDYLRKVTQELEYLLTHLEADNINDTTFERISEMIPRPYTGLPLMDGEASAGTSAAWSRGNHRHPHDDTKAGVTALDAEAAAREAHEADTDNPHSVTKDQVGLGNVANERQYSAQNPPVAAAVPCDDTETGASFHTAQEAISIAFYELNWLYYWLSELTPEMVGAIPATDKGSAGGVAELDANGMVPSAQLPSYVDDVLEYASLSLFPVTGESGKIYVALDTNRTYRWGGSAYTEISESLALGETSSTAYRGDRGKTAYDHSQVTSGNPHNVSASDVGLGNVANERQYSAQNPPPLPTPADIGAATAQDLTDHVGDTNNPHGVTAAQVGLGNVDNVQQYSASNPPPYPVTSVNGSTGAVMLDASDVGARPDTWTPSAADVGARPDTWTPSAADVGARPDTWTPSAADVGARPDTWVPDAEDVPYDNTQSGLTADDVQEAIDELAAGGSASGKADQTTIAPVEASTTATEAHPLGSIFYLSGVLYRALADIAMGGTINTGAGGNATETTIAQNFKRTVTLTSTQYAQLSAAEKNADIVYIVTDEVVDYAEQSQLAYVESGSTASRAYAVGDYFCWGGLLYRAKTAIASGASFTVGTNCEAVTIGDQIKNVPFTLNTSGITQTDYNIRETQFRYIGSGFLIMWFNITCNTPKSDNVIVGSLPAGVSSPSAIITETYVSGAGTAVESMTVQIRTNGTVNCRYGHAGTGYTGTFVIPL